MRVVCKDKWIQVQGSHFPTLDLVGNYFKAVVKKNPRTENPSAAQSQRSTASSHRVYKVNFYHSDLAYGPSTGPGYYDGVLLRLHNPWREEDVCNPTVLLSFVQGVLGYELLSSGTDVWYLQRTRPFVEIEARTPVRQKPKEEKAK
jgi:hypothetical protein